MSLTSLVKGKIIGTVVDKISASEPRTTIAGFVLATVVASNIDYGKLSQGDPTQIGNLIGAIAAAVLGWFANHKNLQPPAPPAVATGAVKP
jgi:hypothetical protein